MGLLRKVVATSAPAAVILVRLMVGAVFLSEGLQKFLRPDAVGAGRFAKIGFPNPEFVASLVGAFEVLCGALVLPGLLTRLAVVPTITIMLVIIASTKVPILLERGFWDDAIAVGQVTPGPVFTTATFIGYLLGGVPGAGVATVGIFLPSFLLEALSGPLIPRIRRSATARAFLDGVNIASLALMAVVTWQLSRAALVDPPTAAPTAPAGFALIRFQVNSAWLILGGGLAGIILSADGLA